MAVIDPRGEKEAFDRNVRSRIAANVTLVSILAVLLVAFVNYAMHRLGRTRDLRFDLTAEKRLALEDSTKSLVRGIDDPIQAYLVFGIDDSMRAQARRELSDRNFDTGFIDKYYRPLVSSMVEQFQLRMAEIVELNPKVQARLIDSEIERDEPVSIQRKLGMGPGQLLNHVVFYNSRTRAKKAISLYQFFKVDLGGPDPTLGYRPPSLAGHNIESRLVIGLRSVVERAKKRVYVVSGQGERPLRGVTDTLRNDNFDVQPLQLLGNEAAVPEDCDLLLVLSPKRSWPAGASTALLRYFDAGGRILMTQGMDCAESFSTLLERAGLRMLPAQIGHPTLNVARLGQYFLYGSDLLRPASGRAHRITEGTVREGLPLEFGQSRGYDLLRDYERDRVERHVLVHSTDGATAMPWIQDGKLWRQAPERGSRTGDFPLMVAATLTPGTDTPEARLVVCGSDDWLREGALKRRVAAANMDVLMNSVYWLTDTEQMIMATPRSFRGKIADLSDGRDQSFMLLTVAIIPGLFLLTGALIFFWRRR